MKKILLILLATLIILGLSGVAYYLLHEQPKMQINQSGTSFPTSTATSSAQLGDGNVSIVAVTGETYRVPSFPKDTLHYELPSGTYYQLTRNIETQGADAQFDIQYGTDNSIQIVLVKEPLKDARLAAEASLRTFFPLANDQLCALNIDVGVPVKVNDVFSGKNLGLSFCPGAVKLP